MTSLESFFFALFEIARSCENFCEIIFGLKQVKALQKRLAEANYKEEKWRNGDKKSSDWLLKDA